MNGSWDGRLDDLLHEDCKNKASEPYVLRSIETSFGSDILLKTFSSKMFGKFSNNTDLNSFYPYPTVTEQSQENLGTSDEGVSSPLADGKAAERPSRSYSYEIRQTLACSARSHTANAAILSLLTISLFLCGVAVRMLDLHHAYIQQPRAKSLTHAA